MMIALIGLGVAAVVGLVIIRIYRKNHNLPVWHFRKNAAGSHWY